MARTCVNRRTVWHQQGGKGNRTCISVYTCKVPIPVEKTIAWPFPNVVNSKTQKLDCSFLFLLPHLLIWTLCPWVISGLMVLIWWDLWLWLLRHKELQYYMDCQSYGFSSSHVWMWELSHEKGWVPKNWWFQTVAGDDSWESLGQQDQPFQS